MASMARSGAAGRQELFVAVDAHETLDRLMVEGSPDPAVFDTLLNGLLHGTPGTRTRPHVFGEMVAVLWEQGNVTAAWHSRTCGTGSAGPVRSCCRAPIPLACSTCRTPPRLTACVPGIRRWFPARAMRGGDIPARAGRLRARPRRRRLPARVDQEQHALRVGTDE